MKLSYIRKVRGLKSDCLTAREIWLTVFPVIKDRPFFCFLHSVTSIQVFHKYEENDRFILAIISVLKDSKSFFSPFSSRKRHLCSLLTKKEGLSSPLEEKGLIFSLKHLSCVFTLKSRSYLRWAKCRGQATVASSGNTSQRNVHVKHFYIISTSDDQFTQTLLSCHWLEAPPSEAVRPAS